MYLCSSEQEDKSSFSPYVSLVSSPNLEMAAGIRTAEIPGSDPDIPAFRGLPQLPHIILLFLDPMHIILFYADANPEEHRKKGRAFYKSL